MVEKNKNYKFYEIIDELRKKYLNGEMKRFNQNIEWCVYYKEEEIDLNTNCYIDEYPEEVEGIYPQFVIENDLKFHYEDHILQDAINVALDMKKEASNSELMEAISYYDETDSFMILD